MIKFGIILDKVVNFHLQMFSNIESVFLDKKIEKMLTVKEAAKKIGVEAQTIRQYITIGRGKEKTKLPAIQTYKGARVEYRIKQSDLDWYKKEVLMIRVL